MAMKSERAILEEALAADFEDVAAHAAYADLLAEQGDPRGEYIRLRLAEEDDSRRAGDLSSIRQRATALFHEHQRDWLGDLAPFLCPERTRGPEPMNPNYEYSFRRGWLVRLEVHQVRSAFLEVLAGAPEARLLQELILAETLYRGGHTPLDPLLDAPHLAAVRRFTLGDPESYGCMAEGLAAVGVVRNLPRLEELTLLAQGLDTAALFALPLPRLRLLRVGFAGPYPFAVLGANPSLGALTHLYLESSPYPWAFDEVVEQGDPGPAPAPGPTPVPREGLRALLRSPHLPALTHLRLRLPGFGDAGCEELANSGILARLRWLDLRGCGVTDDGALALASRPETARLGFLDVGGNAMTGAGVGRLHDLGVRLLCDSQRPGPEGEGW